MPQNEHVRSIVRVHNAKCLSVKQSSTEDGVMFVEANIAVNGQYIHWRGPLTKGGLKKTFFSLLSMGAKMEQNENGEVTDYLKGVGSKLFDVDLVTVECEENEAPGSFRYYVKVVYE
jgi:hypothetical protein